jgi:two-component system, OmpR family, response regulator
MRDSVARCDSIPARILLIDDNNFGVVARKALLEEHGYKITTATDGQQGLETFNRGTFDLVITDYKMPRMDGLELIREIRQQTVGVPIILISGYAEALGMTEESTGADAVIAKSATEVAQLLRAVNRLCRRAAPKKSPASQRSLTRAVRQGGR